MKGCASKLLLLTLSLLLVANHSMADHIGIYRDADGSSCILTPGFTTTPTVIHKFSTGATAVQFNFDLSAAPGSALFGFQTPYQVLSVAPTYTLFYGECLIGSIVVGTMIATLVSGAVSIVPAPGEPTIRYTDCSSIEHAATGGSAIVGGNFDPCYVATESATWGKVKALYH